MKKYLIIGDGESPHILKWVKELDKYFEVYLVSSRYIHKDIIALLPDERMFSFKLKVSESGGNIGFLRMLFPVKRIINRIRPDYVNAHYITSHGFLAALARKLSGNKFTLILSAWGTDILVTPFKNRFYYLLTSFSLKQAKLVTTDSKRVAVLVAEFCDTPISTFPFGLEKLPELTPGEKDQRLFYSNRTLNANSNIDKVLEFFAKVHKIDTKARLVIGNDGPKRTELQKYCSELGLDDAINFIGFTSSDEQDKLYRKAMFYFSILTSDALSVSLLEAMAHGCIPLVSDLPDNHEWVENEVNGIILQDSHTANILDTVKTNAVQIFDMNRSKIREGALFPESIKEYVDKIENI